MQHIIFHPLFAIVSSEMLSVESWLSRSHSYEIETKEIGSHMPNHTRTGLKISGNKFEIISSNRHQYEVVKRDVQIYREWNKRQKHPKKSSECRSRSLEKTGEDYLKK